MSILWKFYQNCLIKYPLLTQAIQTGILMGTGDVMSQTLIEKSNFSQINWVRTCQFGSIGLFVCGPGLRTWYGMLNKYVGNKGGSVALKKVALDQFVFAPVFTGVLLVIINTMQNRSFDTSFTSLKQNYPDIMVCNYKVWPFVQLCNFYLIPLNYQVVSAQFVAIFWNTYISWKTNATVKEL